MKMLNSLTSQFKISNEVVTLGKVQGQYKKVEQLTEGQLNHHVHVVGASGFGKTVLLSHIIKQRIEQGKGLLFIDLKGDIDTIEKFTEFTRECGRAADLQVFSLSDQKLSSTYNFVSEGTHTQLRDKIMSSLTWSEEFYKNQSASYLLKLLIGLCYLRDNLEFKINLSVILKACEDIGFLEELTTCIPTTAKEVKSQLESCHKFLRDQSNFKSLQGLRTQLESLCYADFGKLLTSDQNGINLFESVQNQKIIFIFLDSRRYGDTAKAVGRFILQDLKMTSSKVDAEIPLFDRKPFTVVIDEFADLASEDFIGFLDRARSSKMSVVVAHQEISDLQRISPEFAGRLMGNTSTLYAFLQKRPESVDIIASIAGTRKAWKETIQTSRWWFFETQTGNKSVREVEEFIIHPNMIKNLTVGNCICIKKYPYPTAYLMNVHPHSQNANSVLIKNNYDMNKVTRMSIKILKVGLKICLVLIFWKLILVGLFLGKFKFWKPT